MFEQPPIRFDQPWWLLLLVLIVPCYFMARRSIGGLSRAKATTTFALRVFVILLLATSLARPVWEKRGKGVTVTVLLDRSLSIPLAKKTAAQQFLQRAVEAKEERDDRVAVVTIAKEANIAAMPDAYTVVNVGQEDTDLAASNLAAGVRMAMAIMPDDTANRIVLASDGNETMDSVLAAAELAKANRVPIDVVIVEYEHESEVLFERLITPARARRGQTANLRMILRSQNEASGTIRLSVNDQPIDLNAQEPGEGLHVQLSPGTTTIPVPVSLDEAVPHQFEAVFEPDNRAHDSIERNNRALAVTFVSGEGRVLVVDEGLMESEYLVKAMREADIEVEVAGPSVLAGGLVALSGYDAVILANIPRWALGDEEVNDLHSYVHDFGGGFVMLGGAESFGAGGWIDSPVAKALPVKLDPPQSRQMPRGALALIMHSCEMPQGNFWGQKVAIAAIEALSRLDYVGIVEFNWGGGGANAINGASWAFPMQLAGDKSAAINAAKKMVVGDMPDFDASMQVAFNGLTVDAARAGQRHAIIISDGDPAPPSGPLLQKYIDAGITVTTIMVAGHGSLIDRNSMQNTATRTGGRFYNITNPKQLPQIFIKEAQLVSRSLIQEGEMFQPQVVSRLPGPTEGFSSVPGITGYVLTAQRDGLAQTPIVIATTEGNDPIYAHWNYGLGRSIAYTSDLTGKWGAMWASWAQFSAFWEQSIRWVMRPSSPQNILMDTRVEGDKAIVELEALESDSSFMNFMQTAAVVQGPDGKPMPLTMHQTGPGRYRGEFVVGDAGSYLVGISYATGSAEIAPRGYVQAAVSVPYSREFRSVRDNTALLKDLAERTGGRVLDDNLDPAMADLFQREGLELPFSPKQVWDLLAVIAASLFVIDVAARRVSLDPLRLLGLAKRAAAKRGEASADTVAAWKRAKTQSTSRKAVKLSQREAEPEARRDVKFEATEEDMKKAVDVRKASAGEEQSEPSPRRSTTPAAGAGQEPLAEETTSRLLKAKRRALQQDDDGAPTPPGASS